MPVGITALRLREAAEKLARRYEPESYKTYASARAQRGLSRSAAPPPPVGATNMSPGRRRGPLLFPSPPLGSS
jgi:hypothetical protein